MVPIIKKHVTRKLINGRKYLFAGMFETYKSAVKFAAMERRLKMRVKIYKLEDAKYPYRVYLRKPIMEYDEIAGRTVRKY
jgi:hypothetical protein